MAGKTTTINVTMEVDLDEALATVEGAMPSAFWERWERFGMAVRMGVHHGGTEGGEPGEATTKDTKDTKGEPEQGPNQQVGLQQKALEQYAVEQVQKELAAVREKLEREKELLRGNLTAEMEGVRALLREALARETALRMGVHHGGTEGGEPGEATTKDTKDTKEDPEVLTQRGQSREGAERAGEWEDTSGCGSPGEAE